MNAKTTIRKILFVTIWFCIGGGLLTLLLAAISVKNKDRCSDYRIEIKGARNNLFIDVKDVEQLLKKATGGNIRGELVSSFSLHDLEASLRENTWIDAAELYFDNRDILHVVIREKEPVARIFTVAGRSFYLDSLGREMPLSEKLSARVPVFTGFPEKQTLSARDSFLLDAIKVTANYIIHDPFWMAQVAQVDITPDRRFELVPVVGNHIVKLGDGKDIPGKFRRLMIFYQQVLAKTGFDRYKLIDVQYRGQVIASRYAGDPKVDSVQLRRNVEKLLKQSMEAANDTVLRLLPPPLAMPATDSAIAPDPSLQDRTNNPEQKHDPDPRLSTARLTGSTGQASPTIRQPADGGQARSSSPKAGERKKDQPEEEKRVPKAVMPKKTATEKSGDDQKMQVTDSIKNNN